MSSEYEVINRQGESTIKLLVTINGGAVVAILGFADGLMTGSNPIVTGPELATAMYYFIGGIAAAVLSMASMNLFLMSDADPEWSVAWTRQIRRPARIAAYFLGTASLVAFLLGAGSAASSLAA